VKARKKRVLVSSCLLNEMCRYDGTKKMNIADDLKDYEIISFCPEKFMGVPRKKISLEMINENINVVCEDGMNLTKVLSTEIDDFMNACESFDKIILKSKSPSCGFKTTPILDEGEIKIANGLLVHKLLEVYDEAIFFDETNYKENIC